MTVGHIPQSTSLATWRLPGIVELMGQILSAELCIHSREEYSATNTPPPLPPDDSRPYSTNELASPGAPRRRRDDPCSSNGSLGGTAHWAVPVAAQPARGPPRLLRVVNFVPKQRKPAGRAFGFSGKESGSALARRAPPFRPSCRRCTRWRDGHGPSRREW